MTRPRVFIVNEPMKYDHEQERMVPAKDLSSALEWGPIEFIMPAGEPPLDPRYSIQVIRDRLSTFTFDDYLIPIGHPLLICWSAAIATERAGGMLKLLHWRPKLKRYTPVASIVFPVNVRA